MTVRGSPAPSHTCIHDALARHPPVVVPQRSSSTHGRSLGTAELPGVRIVFDTSTLQEDVHTCYAPGAFVDVGSPSGDGACAPRVGGSGLLADCKFTCLESDVLTQQKQSLLADRLLPVVAAWVAAALKIKSPVQGSLVVDGAPCRFGNEVAMPRSVVAQGSPDTDVYVVVTARPTTGNTVAYAGHCQEAFGAASPLYVPHRGTVGHINIDPHSLSPLVSDAGMAGEDAVDGTLKVLLHEVFHVLGFTCAPAAAATLMPLDLAARRSCGCLDPPPSSTTPQCKL